MKLRLAPVLREVAVDGASDLVPSCTVTRWQRRVATRSPTAGRQ